jgi:hypothetical protein
MPSDIHSRPPCFCHGRSRTLSITSPSPHPLSCPRSSTPQDGLSPVHPSSIAAAWRRCMAFYGNTRRHARTSPRQESFRGEDRQLHARGDHPPPRTAHREPSAGRRRPSDVCRCVVRGPALGRIHGQGWGGVYDAAFQGGIVAKWRSISLLRTLEQSTRKIATYSSGSSHDRVHVSVDEAVGCGRRTTIKSWTTGSTRWAS